MSYALVLNQALFDDLEPGVAPRVQERDSRDLRDALLEISKSCPFTSYHPECVHPDILPVLRALRAFERVLGDEERMPQRWDEVLARSALRW